MTGYLISASGERWVLPVLLQWEITRTDGEPCGSAEIRFRFEPARLDVLKSAVRFYLEEDGKRAFTGVVDEFSAVCGADGRLVTLTGRSLAGLLMDSELRAAQYEVLTLEDAIRLFVLPCGVERVEADAMQPVEHFSTQTGTTCWQAICGYCRHAANVQPRFLADGTLLLKAERGAVWKLGDENGWTEAEYRFCRCGIIGQQVITAAGNDLETAENAALVSLGGGCRKVTLRQSPTMRATWKSARQRVEESLRGALTLTVTVPGFSAAEPGDTVEVSLDGAGITGSFRLRSRTDRCGRNGRQTVLELEGALV